MPLLGTAGPVKARTFGPEGLKFLQTKPLLCIFLVVAACKFAFYLADPYPSFHFGDSGAYLATALVKWIPPDRSFTYGFLLRPLVLNSPALGPVVALQIAASGAASVILGMLLLRCFGAKPAFAIAFACLCAFEPLQLMSERFVMTEAFATFGFALYLWAALSFLRTGQISTLIAVQVLGVVLISLRYSFLPLVLILAVALPILTIQKTRRVSWRPILVRLA